MRSASLPGWDAVGRLRGEDASQPLHRPMEPRLRRGEGDPERRRGLGQGVAEVVVHDDERSLLRVEAGECPLDQVAIRQVAGVVVVVVGSSMGRISTSIGRRRRRRASSRQAFTSRRWSQASNRSGITKPGQVTPGSHQGVLDRVARELAVPEDEARGRVEPGGRRRTRARRRRRDRLAPPARRAARGPRPLALARRTRPGLQGMASAQAEFVSRKPRVSLREVPGRSGPGPRPPRRRTGVGVAGLPTTPGRPRTRPGSRSSQASISVNEVQRRVRPALGDADLLEGLLGEHDVAVAGGVAIRRPVADERHRPPGRLVREHPVALAGAADEAVRVAVGELDPGAVGSERRRGGHDRQARRRPAPRGRAR